MATVHQVSSVCPLEERRKDGTSQHHPAAGAGEVRNARQPPKGELHSLGNMR